MEAVNASLGGNLEDPRSLHLFPPPYPSRYRCESSTVMQQAELSLSGPPLFVEKSDL